MKLCSAIAVIGLALSAAGPAFGNPFPWGPNDKPPMVDGITLGDSEQHVLDVLGPPDDVNTSTFGDMLEYNAKGLEVTASKDGVQMIRLFRPEAGSVGGLSVGDMSRDVITKWGLPQGGEGRVAHFGTNNWVILVRLSDKEANVAEMALASARMRPQQDNSQLNTFKTQ